MTKCSRTNKITYTTWARADRARIKTCRAGNDWHDRRTLEAYRCQHCGLWHIGHSQRLAAKLARQPEMLDVEVGTDNSDDYYPSFVGNWRPERIGQGSEEPNDPNPQGL